MDAMTAVGHTIILGFSGLWPAWVVVENRRDRVPRPRRPTHFIALSLTGLGALSVVLQVVASRRFPQLAFSPPMLASVSCLILGAARPGVGINTAYGFTTLPGCPLLGGMFFLLWMTLGVGCCVIGFRLGQDVHNGGRWVTKKMRSPGVSEAAEREFKP